MSNSFFKKSFVLAEISAPRAARKRETGVFAGVYA
jgi:hypothetical protein